MSLSGNNGERRKIRVAIIGGGCAGMAAAWELAKHPEYDVHVYEKSWRLGGKGASERDTDGRILEHGLHMWLGFYENAFGMMRECYDTVQERKWGPASKDGPLTFGSVEEVFQPEPHLGVGSFDPAGHFRMWSGLFPPEKGLPGTALDVETNSYTLASYILRCVDLLKTLLLSVVAIPATEAPGGPRPDQRSKSDEDAELTFSLNSLRAARPTIEQMAIFLRGSTLVGAAVLLQAVTMIEEEIKKLDLLRTVSDSILHLMEAIATQTRKLLQDVVEVDGAIRMRTEIIDLLMTILVGLFRKRLLFDERGFDALNEFDYRQWLMDNGATKSSIKSPFVTAAYEFAFGFKDGQKDNPRLATGIVLRGSFRAFFTYRGSMFWRLRAGMGDAIFAPLYKVLTCDDRDLPGTKGNSTSEKANPVKFHFLHELTKVEIEERNNAKFVTKLEFATQGDEDMLAQYALDQRGCWPDSPLACFHDAIVAKPKGERQLVAGPNGNFDAVIFAMGIDDFKKVCAFNIDRKDLPPHWAEMRDQVASVATQSAQVWFDSGLDDLGWHRGTGVFTSLYDPLSSWADMTVTLSAEKAWRQGKNSKFDKARSVAYFCSVLPEADILMTKLRDVVEYSKDADPLDWIVTEAKKLLAICIDDGLKTKIHAEFSSSLPMEERITNIARMLLEAKVDANVDLLLEKQFQEVWPDAYDKKNGKTAKDREIGRHVRVNFTGSERYTQSLPNSLAARISPLDRSVDNMTIAGDWTACGIDSGCVEAAVISGKLAAFAISGSPDPKTIIGYHHP